MNPFAVMSDAIRQKINGKTPNKKNAQKIE